MDGEAPGRAPAAPPSVERPLDGVKVVDLSRYLPGPLVTRILGDLGARVLKVEEPRLGDPSRRAPPLEGGRSALAGLLLAGHRSIALDLKKKPAREVLERLLATADVLVESFRPGTLARFGLAPEGLRRRFPRLVICSLTGWGQDGPHAQRAGHDLGYQAIAGSLAASPRAPAVPVADVVGAWSAATAVLAALYRRAGGGDGCWIDQGLLDAAVHANLTGWAAEHDGPRAVSEPLMLSGALAGYRVYRTADGGHLALAALEPRFWRRFCRAVGKPSWIGKQLSADPAHRRAVAALVASRPRDAWQALLDQHDLPGEPVLSAAEARAHPQVAARGLLSDGDDGTVRLAFPARFDGQRPAAAAAAVAALGADTEAVLAELGGEVPPRRRRWRGGIGRRPSVTRWLLRAATAWIGRRRR